MRRNELAHISYTGDRIVMKSHKLLVYQHKLIRE